MVKGSYVFGVCNGCKDAVLNDTVNLVNPGYVEARTAAGNIKVTDMKDNVIVLAVDAKECTKFRVKRVWSNGTTATGIVVYY